MYNNIGEKLKVLAKIVAWLGIITSIIYGIVLIVESQQYEHYLKDSETTLIISGIITIILGSLLSWISSWALYAIGETNTKVNEISNKLSNNYKETFPKDFSGNSTHKFRCNKCESMISEYPCPNCGHSEDIIKQNGKLNCEPQ